MVHYFVLAIACTLGTSCPGTPLSKLRLAEQNFLAMCGENRTETSFRPYCLHGTSELFRHVVRVSNLFVSE